MDRISIEDVAKLAGVSVSTVSKVLGGGSYSISEKTKKKVLEAAKSLNYLPNIAAQQLKKPFNRIIGLIVRDVSDSYFSVIAKGVTKRASDLGYLCFVCNTGRNLRDELQYYEILWQHKVKGVVLSGGGFNTHEYKTVLLKQLEKYSRQGVKIVALAPQGIDMSYVSIDNAAAARQATEYLIKRGHRKIAFIGGPGNVYTALDRLQGYKQSLLEHGLSYNKDLVIHCEFSSSGGYEACMELLSRSREFTSICCANDDVAFGTLHALKEQGISVPEDMSIITIGENSKVQYAAPPLTSVSFSLYDIGSRSVDVIVNDNNTGALEKVLFETKIIERQSVRSIST